MKKTVLMAVLVGLCLAMLPAAEAGAAQPQPATGLWPKPGQVGGAVVGPKRGATVLSLVMPGTGEWLNRDFEGPFPMLECIVGALCFPIMCASALDAAAGDESSAVRANFWSKPKPER